MTLRPPLRDLDLSSCFAADSSRRDPASPSLTPLIPDDAFTSAAAPHVPRRRVVADPDLPESGAIIDKYRLEAILGVGGFAAVYRATHLLLRVTVALKLLRLSVLRNRPKLAELLCEEARFAAQINHPNVVRVFDVTHTDKMTYVVMEYIEGATLAETIKLRGRLPPRQVVRVGLDVCAGLRAGLAQGLVHRDIKPANVMLTESGVAKIVDLGLAHSQLGLNRGAKEADSTALVGTPAYMAPEQAQRADAVDFRADVYSLGVTLYHAASGQAPFAGAARQLIEAHRTQVPPALAQLVPDFPPRLSSLLEWMMQKQPEARPASYEVLEAHLLAVQDELAGADILGRIDR